ncbi:titin [Trichonephila clavata]|uniref:Titin n=1 Tax=Trichonephila clavata TaxID=2740835 RepID=A0A8X6FCJ8_TRICU|nr:titin [Trichonephila clavata]
MALLLSIVVVFLFAEKSFVESGVPKINPFHFSGELDVGMRASVQCAVIYGDPPFRFTWSKDGHNLVDARGVSIGKFDDFTSNLVISKVDADSNGNYTCRVSNSKGSDEKSAELYVKGKVSRFKDNAHHKHCVVGVNHHRTSFHSELSNCFAIIKPRDKSMKNATECSVSTETECYKYKIQVETIANCNRGRDSLTTGY